MAEAIFKAYTNAELSNDDYHDPNSWCARYVSGSSLGEIYATSPAHWKYKEREETASLSFGTCSHTCMLETSKFNGEYLRATAPGDVKDLITSKPALSAKLKACGLIGTSNKDYPELLEMAYRAGIDVNVWWAIELCDESAAINSGRKLVKDSDFDAVVQMRNVMLANPRHAACIESDTAQRELSIFGEIFGVPVKVRLDHVDVVSDPELIKEWGFNPDEVFEVVVITDYKTTQTSKPDDFGRMAFNLGYYLKMALQRDLFVKTYNEKRPVVVRLLTQEKKSPFAPLAFTLTDQQIEIGRKQYRSVIHQYAECVKHDVWPSYESNAAEVKLPTPQFVKYMFPEVYGTNS